MIINESGIDVLIGQVPTVHEFQKKFKLCIYIYMRMESDTLKKALN